jgi:hypothetical protein
MAFTHNGLALCKPYTNFKMQKNKITNMQEGTRKDLEWCFVVLQVHFGIIQNPFGLWQMDAIYEIMIACVSCED